MFSYYLLYVMSWVARIVPEPLGYWLGEKFARGIFRFVPSMRKVTVKNLSICFPEKDKDWVMATASDAFANMGMVAFEFFKFSTLPNALAEKRVVWEDGCREKLEPYVGKSGLIAGAHSGGWDMAGAAFSHMGLKVGVVVSEIRQPGLQKFVHETRSEKGVLLIYREKGVKSKCLQWIHDGNQLALTPDQHAGNRGVQITHFGLPTMAFRGAGEFALDTGLPIVPLFGYRREDKKTGVVMGTPIDPKDYEGEGAITAMSQNWHDQLEAFIRLHPGSYFWMHRRWKGMVEGA